MDVGRERLAGNTQGRQSADPVLSGWFGGQTWEAKNRARRHTGFCRAAIGTLALGMVGKHLLTELQS